MNNAPEKESYIALGDQAFMILMVVIQNLLEVIDFYSAAFDTESPSGKMKQDQLAAALKTFGSVPYQLANIIKRWKTDEERIISKIGVEVDLLNELQITIDTTIDFFERENIDITHLGKLDAKESINTLIRVNRVLE